METPPQLPDLTLLRRIGSGSYGDVWLARTVTGVYRAVKIVDRSRFIDERPFLRELKGITQFQRQVGDRPRQLALMHVGHDEKAGVLYYVMELADDVRTGTDIDPEKYEPLTLRALQEQNGEMSAADCIRLGVELARSLVELHSAGLIHRDIKISNVIFVAGVPKLADIGLVSSSDNSMTVLGTPGYTPAEGAITTSADIYGLGKVLYVLATGQAVGAFPRLPSDTVGRDDASLLLELNDVILRACDPNPANRYRSASEMLDDLLILQAGKSLKEMQRTRERLIALKRVAIFSVGVALLFAAVLAVQNHFNLRKLAEQETAARIHAEAQELQANYTSDLHRAVLSLLNRDIGLARSALRHQMPAPGRTDMRGLEWNALWNETAGDELKVLGEKIGAPPLRTAALSPDGRLLAVQQGDQEGKVLIWDLDTGQSRSPQVEVLSLAGFSSDGSRLLVATPGSGLVWLDQETLAPLTDGTAGSHIVTRLRGGRHIVVSRSPGQTVHLEIWDMLEGRAIAAWDSPPGFGPAQLARATLSADARLLAVCMFQADTPTVVYELQVWKRDPEWTLMLRRPDFFHLEALEFSNDGSRLAIAGPSHNMAIIDTNDGRTLLELPGHKGNVFDIAFAPDNEHVASAGEDQTIRVWDATTGAAEEILRGHEGSVTTLEWRSRNQIVSTGMDGTVRLWRHPAPQRARARGGFWNGFLGDFIYTPDSQTIIATMANGSLGEIDADTLKPTGRTWAALHPLALRGNTLWALTEGLTLARCDLETGAVEHTGLQADRTRRAVYTAASPDARILLVGMGDGFVELWDTSTGAALTSIQKHTASIFAAAFSPDGTIAATGDVSGVIWFWNPADGTALRSVSDSTSAVMSIDISRDGHLAVGREDGSLTIFDAQTGKLLARRMAHSRGINALEYSPQGTRLFTGSYDGVVASWSVPNYREVGTLPVQTMDDSPKRPDTRPGLIHFAPDESRVTIFTEEGWLRSWDLRPSDSH